MVHRKIEKKKNNNNKADFTIRYLNQNERNAQQHCLKKGTNQIHFSKEHTRYYKTQCITNDIFTAVKN